MSIPGVPDEFEELMPCSACPDGYVWDSNGPTCKPCPVCKGHAAVGYRAAQTEQTSGGTQQRPEQASASKPESRPGPLDPIADLCARLRDEYEGCPSPVTTARVATLREAADALERLRAERAEAKRDVWKDKAEMRRREGCKTRAERDALRTSLRALLSYVDDGALLMRTEFPKSRNGRHIDADEASANIEYNECIREVISTARAKVAP